MKHDFVELAAEVCYQLFFGCGQEAKPTESPGGIEVTQIVHLDTTQNEAEEGNAAKRRKIHLSFKSCLLDSLRPKQMPTKVNDRNSDEAIIPHLQIISRMMRNFPSGFAKYYLGYPEFTIRQP